MSQQTLQVDLSSKTPVYQQIVDGLRAKLVSGELEPGVKLPPVRQLAIDLSVHHNTVAEAYRMLAEEGWLSLKRGRGAIVQCRQNTRASKADEAWLKRQLKELSAKGLSKGVSKSRLINIFQDALNDIDTAIE